MELKKFLCQARLRFISFTIKIFKIRAIRFSFLFIEFLLHQRTKLDQSRSGMQEWIEARLRNFEISVALFQVRRVRRCNSSSPDSDDTYGGEEDEVGLGKDDQYLVSDRTENKFYGSVHAAAAASSCGSAHQYPGNTPIIGPPLNYLQRRLQVDISNRKTMAW